MPSAAIMPRKSSGEVSTRASTTFSPFFERATASSALKTTWPDAAPGPAAKPLPIFFASLADCRSKIGASRCASESAGMRLTASSLEISFSPTISTAMDGGMAGALSVACLQNVKVIFFHREFEVLHVLEMLFQDCAVFHQVFMHRRHFLREVGDRMRRAHARDHIFALGVDQIFAVKNFFAACRVAGESNSGRARLTHVSKHHRLDIDRRSRVVRNPIFPAINNCAIVHPRTENCTEGAPELHPWVLRERLSGSLLD